MKSDWSIFSAALSAAGYVLPTNQVSQADSEKIGRGVIVRHLRKIRESGILSGEILTETYWRDVFADAGYSDLYESSRGLLRRAIRAGLRSYRDGDSSTAEEFADRAIDALVDGPKIVL